MTLPVFFVAVVGSCDGDGLRFSRLKFSPHILRSVRCDYVVFGPAMPQESTRCCGCKIAVGTIQDGHGWGCRGWLGFSLLPHCQDTMRCPGDAVFKSAVRSQHLCIVKFLSTLGTLKGCLLGRQTLSFWAFSLLRWPHSCPRRKASSGVGCFLPKMGCSVSNNS